MKKWLLLLICSLFGVSLSGCSLQNVVESVSPSREETPQDIEDENLAKEALSQYEEMKQGDF